jgi:hypothetical protein
MNEREFPITVALLFNPTTLATLWPASGSADTKLGALMELEVGHGETEVYPRIQA